MAHTCHHHNALLCVIRLTWTPSLPWLPCLYMSLPLVPSPSVIVSVSESCLCVFRVFLVCIMLRLFIKTLTPWTCFPTLSAHRYRMMPHLREASGSVFIYILYYLFILYINLICVCIYFIYSFLGGNDVRSGSPYSLSCLRQIDRLPCLSRTGSHASAGVTGSLLILRIVPLVGVLRLEPTASGRGYCHVCSSPASRSPGCWLWRTPVTNVTQTLDHSSPW
jgi:hypothetical protein